MPPEKSAYALARYSRSPDSIRDSIEWVRTHDSAKFLESFYFQYGHASIADLGHLGVCFEGISELAAAEIEDEQLWDGQARSSRYQDFAKTGFIIPPELQGAAIESYESAAQDLIKAYRDTHEVMVEFLTEKLPCPPEMKPDAYRRNIAARAFDVARYLLFLGIPTGVGQVVSIRTLEKQIRRLKASEYLELRELAEELALACASPPACAWDSQFATEPVAPTLARHVEPDTHPVQARADLQRWAEQNLGRLPAAAFEDVELVRPDDTLSDIAATLLYPVTLRPFRELYETVREWSRERRMEVLDVAVQSRSGRDELLRGFRSAPYAFDIVMDIGAYRDLHRHRRCQQFRQAYSGTLGYETPHVIEDAGLLENYQHNIEKALGTASNLPAPAGEYLLPFATRSRFLFKMDFAEAEYICRLRSGVKGHFSYRSVAWRMKLKMELLEPEMGRLLTATPPSVEDPLKR
jgi:thymidylate synthase ThyX